MTYIVQRKDRFYVVAYDGIDPLTGRSAADGIPSATTASRRRGSRRPLDANRVDAAPMRRPVTSASS